ncbi:MAG: hypothetical protein M3Q49_00770 [Actinomycetota bacterium]|nr:hypothetical protein [Actinomycetota bacterium]
MDTTQAGPAEPAYAGTIRRFVRGDGHRAILLVADDVIEVGIAEHTDFPDGARILRIFSTGARARAFAQNVQGLAEGEYELTAIDVRVVDSLVERDVVDGVSIDAGSEEAFEWCLRWRLRTGDVPGLQIRLVP